MHHYYKKVAGIHWKTPQSCLKKWYIATSFFLRWDFWTCRSSTLLISLDLWPGLISTFRYLWIPFTAPLLKGSNAFHCSAPLWRLHFIEPGLYILKCMVSKSPLSLCCQGDSVQVQEDRLPLARSFPRVAGTREWVLPSHQDWDGTDGYTGRDGSEPP